jgi:hypothetical protein
MREAVKVESLDVSYPLTDLRRILDSFGRIGAGVAWWCWRYGA